MIEFCGKDNVAYYKNNEYIAYFPFVGDDYFYNMILIFSDKCECLEPEQLGLKL